MDEMIKQYEEGLIGAALNDVDGYVMQLCEKRGVEADWFASPEAQIMWPILMKQWQMVKALNGPSAADASGMPGALAWIINCAKNNPIRSFVPGYIEKLGKARTQRRIVAFAMQVLSDAKSMEAQDVIARIETNVSTLLDESYALHRNFIRVEDVRDQILTEFRTLHQKRVVEGDQKYYNGLRLPWDVLNSVYTGVKPGIHVIGARPSNGKTALTICLSSGMAFDGIKQLIFSRDMDVTQFVARFGSFHGRVSLRALNNGGTKDDLEKMANGLDLATRHKAFIFSSSIRVDRIVGEIYSAVRREGVKCVWIDYIQIISGDKEYYRSHKEEIDDVLSQLKQCAFDLQIPIFCLAQLNRDTGKDPNRKPVLTDIGDSGNIEREASTVLLLWKDPRVLDVWEKTPPIHLTGGDITLARSLDPMWLILAKNQQGPTCEFPFVHYRPYFMFRPGDYEAKHKARLTASEDDDDKNDFTPYFNVIRDDFINCEDNGHGLDDHLRRAGSLGRRGM
jgi:replicative DNA helicase